MESITLWCDTLEETGGRAAFEKGEAMFREPGPLAPEDKLITIEYEDQLDLTVKLRAMLKRGDFGEGFGSKQGEEDGSCSEEA